MNGCALDDLSAPLCPSGLTTTTLVAPTMPGGAVTRMLVELRTATGEPEESFVRSVDPSDGPKTTWAPAWKSVPVIVTSVPPVTGPDVGETLVTVGAGT